MTDTYRCNGCAEKCTITLDRDPNEIISCILSDVYEFRKVRHSTHKASDIETKEISHIHFRGVDIPVHKNDSVKDIEDRIDKICEKKPQNISTTIRYFNSKEEAEQFEKDHIEPVLSHQTPNCSVCLWKEKPFDCKIESFEHLNRAMNEYAICSAQAFRSVEKCYNNDECKALFEPKQPDGKIGFEKWKKETPEATFIPAGFEETPIYINKDFAADQQSAQIMAWNAARNTQLK